MASILSSESLDTDSQQSSSGDNNCYICLDVTWDGNYVAVKDMRALEEDTASTTAVGIWRSDLET